jgi:hypothetical protein
MDSNIRSPAREALSSRADVCKFDALFLADVLGVYDVFRGSPDAAIANASYGGAGRALTFGRQSWIDVRVCSVISN